MKKQENKKKIYKKRLYITKTRWGNYSVLTEEQYEKKLIFG